MAIVITAERVRDRRVPRMTIVMLLLLAS